MSTLVDLVKINVASTGTGTLKLGTAITNFRGIEALTNGATYGYSIQQNGLEYGHGTYLSATSELTRTPLFTSNGGSPLNLQYGAVVSFVALAEDMGGGGGGGSYTDEQVRDVIGSALRAGTNVTIAVDDAADTITINAAGAAYTDEMARDAIGAALVAGTNISIVVNDAANTITINATGGSSYTDEQARDAIGAALVAGPNITIAVDDPGNTITISGTGGSGGVPGINPKDYGAVGNDSADDTSAINSAITAARTAGRPLFLPKGTYRISSTINLENVGLTGEGASASLIKLMHTGIGIQIGLPVGTSSVDTYNRTWERFGIVANANTTTALYAMRCIYCAFSGIEITVPAANSATFKAFRISGAMYLNRFENLIFDTADSSTTASHGIGFHIGNGYNEVNNSNAATNDNTFINCRACRIPTGWDLDYASGCVLISPDAEVCPTVGINLRGSYNTISAPWLESADIQVNTWTPINVGGGLGGTGTPSGNSITASALPCNVNVIASNGIGISGFTFSNFTLGASSSNTRVSNSRVNGTFTDSGGADDRLDMVINGINTRIVKNGTTVIFKEEANASQSVWTLPGTGPRTIESHSAGNIKINGGTQPIELAGTMAALKLPKITDPGSAPTAFAYLFAVDNGSGKCQLKVRFPSGVAQTLATEP